MAQNPKPWRQWTARLQRRLGRPWPRPLPGKRLGYTVEVVEDLTVWSYAGGWADGFWTLHAGARVRLTHQHNGFVFYRPLVAPPWDDGGGNFTEADSGKVRRLDGRPLLLEKETPSGLLLAALEVLGVHGTVEAATEQGITVRVASRDILERLGPGLDGARPGLPAYVLGIPVRYRTEDGQTLGIHGPGINHRPAAPAGQDEPEG